MIGKSLPALIGIRLAISCLRSIMPLSFAWIFASLFLRIRLFSPWIAAIAVPEVLFYLLFYLPRQAKILQPSVHPPDRLTREERQTLFQNCTHNASHLPQWFFTTDSADLKRENITEWLLWAFFGVKVEDVEKEELVHWNDEINSYVDALETIVGHPFPPGRNPEIKSMRLSFDPVVMLHRPLLWYIIVGIIDMLTAAHLAVIGLTHHAPNRWFQEFPSRPWTLLSRKSCSTHLPYWFRPHRSTTKKPVIFIHGIGIGLFPYTRFLGELDPEVGILLIEILPISTRMTSEPVLPRPVMLDEFYAITAALDIKEPVLVSHSYGTVIAGHIMRSQQRTRGVDSDTLQVSTKITGYCYVDPIPFQLHLPDIIFNFLYRKPKSANEWLLWYFASRDADVGRTLGRHFFWTENVIFKEDLKDENVGIVLSGDDQIVPSTEVWTYLTGEAPAVDNDRWVDKAKKLEILYYPFADHATIFDRSRTRKRVLELVNRLLRA